MTLTVLVQFGLALFVFIMLLLSAAAMVYAERKLAAAFQQRRGPNRVGPMGLLQPFADVIKLMFKEQLQPGGADRVLFVAAPIISATCAFAAFSVVPFGGRTTFFGLLPEPISLQVADVNVAILVVFAIASMSVYGIVLAGWASNSKYSLLGALRSASQMISYEISYGLALAAVLVLAGSLSVSGIVDAQAGYWRGVLPRWFVFLQPLGFLIYMTAGVAETNRAPFDFPEAEQELVAGYHTEYSSTAFMMFFLAEYINMVTVSAIATSLFLGGWHGPFLPESLGWIWFVLKVSVLLFLYIWIRWTLPRYRYDQLMHFGWKILLPAAVVNLILTAAMVVYLLAFEVLFFYALAAAAIVASLLVIGQRNPMHSVMLLIASFAALAGLYVLLDAPFVAVIQIIIYTGAILVLFLFVVMLLNAPREGVPEDAQRRISPHGPRRLGAMLAGVLALELIWAVWAAFGPRGAPAFEQGGRATEAVSSVRRIGQVLFTDYAFAFEVTSLLIIVAMIGAVVLAKRRMDA